MATLSAPTMPVNAPASPWERLADLRLRLRDSVQVHEHCYRNRPWFLLRDTLGKQQFRLSHGAYKLIARLDGNRTLAEAYAPLGTEGATQKEPDPDLLSVVTQLHAAGLLTVDGASELAPLLSRERQQRRQTRLSRWLRLMSPRMALFDPDLALQRGLPWVAWLFHPFSLLLGLLLTMAGGIQAMMNFDALSLYGAQRLNDPQSWLLLVCLYPLVKGLHEFGHGFAARSAGVEVHEMGITLLVFMPVPYVDASAASGLADKGRRMLIGAAGIVVELLLASLAMFAWFALDDGLLRDLVFSVMLIGGISTLLFNGNPLLRFDGYYVLSDAIEVPNLASRAGRYTAWLARYYLLGLTDQPAPSTAPGERRWLILFGLLSPAYRLAIGVGIALFLVAKVPTLGVLMAAWVLGAQFLVPLVRQLQFLSLSPMLAGRRFSVLLRVALILVVVGVTLAMVPVPSSTKVDGVVLLPEQAALRAGAEGFLVEQRVGAGETVVQGQTLFQLRNDRLAADAAVLEARVKELLARRDSVAFGQHLARSIQDERLVQARRELRELQDRLARLQVRSPSDGVFQTAWGADRIGRLISQGAVLGYVASHSDHRVRVVANQQDAARIRDNTREVVVRLAGRGEFVPGRLIGGVPAASDRLPSAALGSRGGGSIPVDARDPQGLTTLHKVFAFDIAVPFTRASQFVGSRVTVRFRHAASPLLARWYDGARRLLIAKIGE